MQVLAGQLLESKHHLLQARVEHLELDLGFKAGCQRPVSFSEKLLPRKAICGTIGLLVTKLALCFAILALFRHGGLRAGSF